MSNELRHERKTIGLKRCFGLKESITLTVGTVIGGGLFTLGGSVVASDLFMVGRFSDSVGVGRGDGTLISLIKCIHRFIAMTTLLIYS